MRVDLHRAGLVAAMTLVLLSKIAGADDAPAPGDGTAEAVKRVIADIKLRLAQDREARAAAGGQAPATLARSLREVSQERDGLQRELAALRAAGCVPRPAGDPGTGVTPVVQVDPPSGAGAAPATEPEAGGLRTRLTEAQRQVAETERQMTGLRQDLAARDARIARLEREIERRPPAGPAAVQNVAPAAGPGPGAARPTPADRLGWTTTVLDAAAFGRSGSALSRDGQRRVARVAELVREGKGPVRLVGHFSADTELPPGASDPERATALQRAQRVRDLLVSRYGIDAARISVDAAVPDHGPPEPEGSAFQGRRVEVFIAQP